MEHVQICFEIQNMAVDEENGKAVPAGVCVEMEGISGKKFDENDLKANFELIQLLLKPLLDDCTEKDIRIITPEEYRDNYEC